MAYQIATFRMTLSDLHSHLPIASLSKCDFLYSCSAAVDKILTNIVCRSVPLR